VGTARFGKVAGTLRSAGKRNRRRHRGVASLGKHGTAAPNTDSDSHPYAEPNSVDLADSFCVTDTDSDVQRDTLAHVTTADPSHIRVSDANAERIVLTGIKKSDTTSDNSRSVSASTNGNKAKRMSRRFHAGRFVPASWKVSG